MGYYITRDGQQHGPYSREELQSYMTEGRVLPGDMARSDEGNQVMSVQEIVGGQSRPAPPSFGGYGQVPVYSGSDQAVPPGRPDGPRPPGLHWAVVALLGVVTAGLFWWVWMFVESSFAGKLRQSSGASLFYGLSLPGILIGEALEILGLGMRDMGVTIFGLAISLGAVVLLFVGHFNLRRTLQDYYTQDEPINLQLSGVMTFFFNIYYFQYHLRRIRQWKETGVLQ